TMVVVVAVLFLLKIVVAVHFCSWGGQWCDPLIASDVSAVVRGIEAALLTASIEVFSVLRLLLDALTRCSNDISVLENVQPLSAAALCRFSAVGSWLLRS
ncbi:MAG: hypothetical protein WAU06_07740, partial [Candidatus Nanopelagicales bacterium]